MPSNPNPLSTFWFPAHHFRCSEPGWARITRRRGAESPVSRSGVTAGLENRTIKEMLRTIQISKVPCLNNDARWGQLRRRLETVVSKRAARPWLELGLARHKVVVGSTTRGIKAPRFRDRLGSEALLIGAFGPRGPRSRDPQHSETSSSPCMKISHAQ